MDPSPDLTGRDHRRGHEPIDLDLRPLALFVVALVTTAAVVHLVLALQLGWYSRGETPAAVKLGPLPPLKRQPTAEPRLQEAPALDLAAMRRREQAELHSSGWVDEKARTVRIPIDEAMRLIAAKGLPARKSPAESSASPFPKTSDAR